MTDDDDLKPTQPLGDGGSAIVGTRSIYLKLYNAKTIRLFIQLVSL